MIFNDRINASRFFWTEPMILVGVSHTFTTSDRGNPLDGSHRVDDGDSVLGYQRPVDAIGCYR